MTEMTVDGNKWFLFFVTLQTDDKGVFSTDLSQEYQLAASTFGLSREDVWKLSQQAIDCIFAADTVKQQLKQKWIDLQPQVFKWPIQWNIQPNIYLKVQFLKLFHLTFYKFL